MHRLTVSAAAMNPKERCAKQHYVTAVGRERARPAHG
jgi:hypothetical protein